MSIHKRKDVEREYERMELNYGLLHVYRKGDTVYRFHPISEDTYCLIDSMHIMQYEKMLKRQIEISNRPGNQEE